MTVRPQWASQIARRIRLVVRPRSAREAARLINAADILRGAGRHGDAALLYSEALERVPGNAGAHVQAGHMFKEARDFDAAERHYGIAEKLKPNDADLQLQLGHFNKKVDRLERARTHYERAVALAPDWAEAKHELHELVRQNLLDSLTETINFGLPIEALIPGPIKLRPIGPIDVVEMRRLGGRQWRTDSGSVPLLCGVEAIRGLCCSDRPFVEVILLIDGKTIAREPLAASATTATATADPAMTRTVFNLWVDLAAVPPGLHRLDLMLADARGWTCRHVERVVVAPTSSMPPSATAPFDSDGYVTLIPGDARTVEQQVRGAPSVVRPVAAMAMPAPTNILVLRTDQLGDIVVSVPALRRLRALFPKARIVGLLTVANVELAQSLGLFDEVLIADFPDDPEYRHRVMTADAQQTLAARLAGYGFDVAIDLATSDVSRPLLRLAGAKLTFGFDHDESPWLGGGISGRIRDRCNSGEASSQSGRILALVERLGTLCATGAEVISRADLDRERLIPLGLGRDDQFVVLHTGARVTFSRWAGFPDLARAWLARHPGKVVLLTQGTDLASVLPDDLNHHERLILIDHKLAFDDLDALVSFATVFVGNDSGPKHFAGLRGTPVVSIHCARISWAEWSQEQTGVVISRRVPCAGCTIFHEPEECGKNFACMTDISVTEVLTATEALLAQ